MYIIRFLDGWVIGTSTKCVADYLWENYEDERYSMSFVEDIEYAISISDEIVE